MKRYTGIYLFSMTLLYTSIYVPVCGKVIPTCARSSRSREQRRQQRQHDDHDGEDGGDDDDVAPPPHPPRLRHEELVCTIPLGDQIVQPRVPDNVYVWGDGQRRPPSTDHSPVTADKEGGQPRPPACHNCSQGVILEARRSLQVLFG